jgi:hypothetical protein
VYTLCFKKAYRYLSAEETGLDGRRRLAHRFQHAWRTSVRKSVVVWLLLGVEAELNYHSRLNVKVGPPVDRPTCTSNSTSSLFSKKCALSEEASGHVEDPVSVSDLL